MGPPYAWLIVNIRNYLWKTVDTRQLVPYIQIDHSGKLRACFLPGKEFTVSEDELSSFGTPTSIRNTILTVHRVLQYLTM